MIDNNSKSKCTLAPWGMCSRYTKGRKYEEAEHPYRSAFQRDRDRIIHCSAFRRLEYKTQVFVYHEGDYYRTRLTHSLEVAQIARSIARVLEVNEDLCEAIALAHDLGHPPFGHSGEKLLNELMGDYGGFEHNRQSLRIVDHIENRYPQFRGLNLSFEVREGLAKHLDKDDSPGLAEFNPTVARTLEAQIVDIADGIAYNSHDLDDGITSGLINIKSLHEVAIWRKIYEELETTIQNCTLPIKKYQMIRGIINMQVSDFVQNLRSNLDSFSINSIDDVRNCKEKIVSFSPDMAKMNTELKRFLRENMYRHQRVVRMEQKAGRTLKDLFAAFMDNSRLLPINVYSKLENESKERLICDYVAGMTDRFAMEEHNKLFNPYVGV